MKLFKTKKVIVLQNADKYYSLNSDWDSLINRDNLYDHLVSLTKQSTALSGEEANTLCNDEVLAPIGNQEIWAAGVTWLRSRDARMEESKESGGATFYDKVYVAERPELFFKGLAHSVAAHQEEVYIRKDSTWNVPEPELTLFINSKGQVQGYTIGNDMSSRSIEGENPLYLPQAKVYKRSAALGPCLLVNAEPVSSDSVIAMTIERNKEVVYKDSVPISRMKRTMNELAEYLYRESEYPSGCFLMTGTCLVPGNDFTLNPKDIITISIDGIGTLKNIVGIKPS
jgi:2-dehydro-3-deoxy-D-arabinonate dehydratase